MRSFTIHGQPSYKQNNEKVKKYILYLMEIALHLIYSLFN